MRTGFLRKASTWPFRLGAYRLPGTASPKSEVSEAVRTESALQYRSTPFSDSNTMLSAPGLRTTTWVRWPV